MNANTLTNYYIAFNQVYNWESYESNRTTVRDTFTTGFTTVYPTGTGFATTTYNVAYYDGTASGGGNKVATDSSVSVTTGTLNSTYLLTSVPSAVSGTWHALVQPASATAFPSAYNDAIAAPDTYSLLANDSFTVDQSAIPEFTSVITGIAVAGMCAVIYWWMRKRVHRVYGVA